MLVPSYLSASRHGVYYFRFPIPQHLHPERRRLSVRVSLGTRCPREALHVARLLGYSGERLLGHQRIGTMEYQEIRALLHEHFTALLERGKIRIAADGPLSKEQKDGFHNARAWLEQSLKDDVYLAWGSDEDMGQFMDKYALSVDSASPQYPLFRREYVKAYRDYCSALLEHDALQDGYDFSTSKASVVATMKPKRLADAIKAYCDEKVWLKQWRPQIALERRGQFDLLLRYLGEGASLHVSPEVAMKVKHMLAHLPKNYLKKPAYKGLPLDELVALCVPENERLSPVTVAKYMNTFSTFFTWAVKRKETPENNFQPLVDDAENTALDRKPFNGEEASRIIQAATIASKPHHKWGTLIAFYTGARLNEIAQLDAADIVQRQEVWCFHFTDQGSELKKLKNKESERFVPVHSSLIEQGFLDYVEAQKGGRLFPGLSYHPKDGYGRNLGRWFINALLRQQLGIDSPALVFHSIRHTVAQKLRNNKVDVAALKDVLGHAHHDVTMGVYATDLDMAVMKEAIETLRY